ncbi:MAG: L-glutamate gamma-semialdehyde dehydrogenase [Flavobacteriales bacterium]|nr:L-glutamate gamma-semialdehyde dehydrogenase [Flavobacteriales bacterium]
MFGVPSIPKPANEPVKSYAPGTPERRALKEAIARLRTEVRRIPMFIGDREVYEGPEIALRPPHDHGHILGYYTKSTKAHVQQAIEAALKARSEWAEMPWESRAAIFLKMAELISGPYRYELNAATMLGQSKNVFQAEIDSACEIIDFLRFNVYFLDEIYREQPLSPPGYWNRMEWRPLEGFVYALTPFNFTAIAGNLPTSCAMCGNVVVWKPSNNQIYSAYVLMKIFRAAGLPPGVINLIYPSGPDAADVILSHPDFAGIHYTGSTSVFQQIWKRIGENIALYKNYPRIVGETGGKDFVVVHHSADPQAAAVALVRGAFEYQGQKCSAASRAYIPVSLWPAIREAMGQMLSEIRMGGVEDFRNFINAVIDEASFDKLKSYIDAARQSNKVRIVFGGRCDKSVGYFVEPTVLETSDPYYITMCEELFGPVLTVYVYKDDEWENTLQLVDNTSPYGLTGAIFAQDRKAIELAHKILRHAAGNYYINDKPTGAIVAQQPFGGARASGTNDKAGSKLNLYRWLSPRAVKETFIPPRDYTYPFMAEE